MKEGKKQTLTYWQVFRFIFVVFSFYLLGVVLWRWDGFRYYATFAEFLPNVALVTIFWNILALLTAAVIWLPLKLFETAFSHAKKEIAINTLLMFVMIFVLVTAVLLFTKNFFFEISLTLQTKLLVLCSDLIFSIFMTWLVRKKSVWSERVQERLIPLVWIFGMWAVISFPVMAYFLWSVHPSSNSSNVVIEQTREHDAEQKGVNIILFTFDALTAEDMSVYGYDTETTPYLTDWAKTASLFLRAEAATNFTTPATASLMTGKRVWTHRTFHLRGSKPVRSETENLPILLKKSGYNTMAFIANPVASVETLGISDGFNVAPLATEFVNPKTLHRANEDVNFGYIDKFLYNLFAGRLRLYNWILKGDFIVGNQLNSIPPRKLTVTTVPPKLAIDKFMSYVETANAAPFFAWIHVLPPHDPYLPPSPYRGMFGSSNKNSRERYDEFIRYCDEEFKYFIRNLDEQNLLKDTIIILSADHGESFEHGYYRHSESHLYEQVTHIPLIIKLPGQEKGRIIENLVEQIDIPATILDLAGSRIPSWMEGRSLLPLMHGENMKERPAFSMTFRKNSSMDHLITRGTIAVWYGYYKLIHYFDEKTSKSLLYNLKEDPSELKNLIERAPETGQFLLEQISMNLEKANVSIRRDSGQPSK